jgi:MYXO-CTERM domain-containing protein
MSTQTARRAPLCSAGVCAPKASGGDAGTDAGVDAGIDAGTPGNTGCNTASGSTSSGVTWVLAVALFTLSRAGGRARRRRGSH